MASIPPDATLPQGFVCVRDVLDGNKQEGSFVNMIGIVTDVMVPTPTRGSDWKSRMSFFDHSSQGSLNDGIQFHIFRREDELPNARLGDLVLIYQVKIQQKDPGVFSLVTNFRTIVLVFAADKIPRQPAGVMSALRSSNVKVNVKPSPSELQFVCRLFHGAQKDHMPTEVEFIERKLLSANVKQKFCLLKEVHDGRFCDLIVQVVKEPYDQGDKLSLWISDYTENKDFFSHAFKGDSGLTAQGASDVYGYTTRFSKKPEVSPAWTGPFGQKSLQITCFEPHAGAMREYPVVKGSWVQLKNVQIKYGRNGGNLEGFLREDRGSHGTRIGVTLMDTTEESENVDPRLKDAVRRKLDYEKQRKKQLKGLTEAVTAGQKRKADREAADELPKDNARSRRSNKRAKNNANKLKEQVPGKEQGEATEIKSGLNPHVKCENPNQAASKLQILLESRYYQTTVDGKPATLKMPFTNINYRSYVRVVDFYPPKLEDFACPKKASTEYDMLSDRGESDSDADSDSEDEMMGLGNFDSEARDWEWRFFLALEDAAAPDKEEKKRIWVAVDNQAAQCLLNIDAANLRQDFETLDALRNQLFLLWGNLEELKLRQHIRAAKHDGPPPSSSPAEARETTQDTDEQVSNLPFSCCIRQYGVRISESEASQANAGSGKRWQQMFGLFGTVIKKA